LLSLNRVAQVAKLLNYSKRNDISAIGLTFESGSQNSQDPPDDPYILARMGGLWLLLVHLSQALFTSFFTKE